ncbi:hypothetical protein Tco_0849139 [Tanacetum coccineum]
MVATPSPRSVCTILHDSWCIVVILSVSSPNEPKSRVFPLNAIQQLVTEEEKLLCQHAKVEWLSAGDKNSAYFHKVIKGRGHQNHIATICDKDGNMFSRKEVEDQVLKHFQNFLGEAKQTKSINDCNVLFEKTMEGSDKVKMIRVVTNEEIRNAIFDIADNKAPNGFTSLFFTESWNVVGNDVCNAVREFFCEG